MEAGAFARDISATREEIGCALNALLLEDREKLCCSLAQEQNLLDEVYELLLKLGFDEDRAWTVATDAAALGLSHDEILQEFKVVGELPDAEDSTQDSKAIDVDVEELPHAEDSTQDSKAVDFDVGELPHAEDSTQDSKSVDVDKKDYKVVEMRVRGCSLSARDENATMKVADALLRMRDPVLRELGAQAKNIVDFFSVSLTVVGCVGRKFAECLAGWVVVQHFPETYPSMGALRGYDEDGELHMMLGARLRVLRTVLPTEFERDFQRLQQLGNRECHDNDSRHRLQDAQKLEIVQAVTRLGSAATSGRFARCPRAEERLCQYFAKEGHCKFGDKCHFKHGSICKYNHMCGGCTNASCKYVHVAECTRDDCADDYCLFDHTRKPKDGKGRAKDKGKGKARGKGRDNANGKGKVQT